MCFLAALSDRNSVSSDDGEMREKRHFNAIVMGNVVLRPTAAGTQNMLRYPLTKYANTTRLCLKMGSPRWKTAMLRIHLVGSTGQSPV